MGIFRHPISDSLATVQNLYLTDEQWNQKQLWQRLALIRSSLFDYPYSFLLAPVELFGHIMEMRLNSSCGILSKKNYNLRNKAQRIVIAMNSMEVLKQHDAKGGKGAC